MKNETGNLAKLFAACWNDADLKARFMSDPASVLAEYGMDVPEGIKVNVCENSDTCVHLTLPATPENVSALSDDELANVAGGVASTGFDPDYCSEYVC
ncbi:MAG: NHLP leader peptide family RiPP precursor [Pirellulales bacterium]|jgi:hypothetical protein|nr:NHLP leader peptide family RiPP precursor [Pirellulales bacterium]